MVPSAVVAKKEMELGIKLLSRSVRLPKRFYDEERVQHAVDLDRIDHDLTKKTSFRPSATKSE